VRPAVGDDVAQIDLGAGRGHDHRHRAGTTIVHQGSRDVEAALVSKRHVDEHEIWLQRPYLLERLASASCDSEDGEPLALEQDARGLEKRSVVVDDQAAHERVPSIAGGLRACIAASRNPSGEANRVKVSPLPSMKTWLGGGIVVDETYDNDRQPQCRTCIARFVASHNADETHRHREALTEMSRGAESFSSLDPILAAAMDGLITVDERGRVCQWNPAAERMFGYSREQAMGRAVVELVIPPKQRRAYREGVAQARAGGPPRILGRRIAITAMRADGVEFPVEITVTQAGHSPPRFTVWMRGLSASEELMRSAFDHAPIGMSAVSVDGKWLSVNDAYCRMLGYERDELIGKRFRDLTHPDDVAEDDEFVAGVAAGRGDSLERDRRYLHRDGSIVWVHVRAEVIRDPAGVPLYALSHLQDITDRKRSEQQLRDSERRMRSLIDNTPSLVYVKGRDYRYELVNAEFERVFGVRGDWIVGRRDEDILPATAIGHVRATDRQVLEDGRVLQEETAVNRNGRERVLLTVRFPLFDERGAIEAVGAMSTDITERQLEERSRRERLQCSELIHTALAEDRFVLHGQPILDLASMQFERSELLIRMRITRDGDELMAPAAFLPCAERFGLIQLVDRWVIARAVELAADGHRVEVNLSAKTICDPMQVTWIERAILASGAPPANLIFEITETTAAGNLTGAREFAQRLRELGCAFALDDFGVGHGTFTYLRHLPVDYLKIDIQFVRNLLNDGEDQQVVRAIIGVAKQFKIETIAEGVEDEATLKKLVEMGVDYAQGHHIGRPAPIPNQRNLSQNEKGDAHATQREAG
jgi:PAS domain S-box-containing protein